MIFYYVNFAGFPAIRAIIFSVHAETNRMLSVAVAAITIANALTFREVALRTQNRALHFFRPIVAAGKIRRRRKMPSKTIGQSSNREQGARTVLSNITLAGAPVRHTR
jgi:hypothetical protein